MTIRNKVLVYKTKQIIEEETYYTCSTEVYEQIKNAKSEDEKMKIWNEFDLWESKLVGNETENYTTEKIDVGIHHHTKGEVDIQSCL